MRTASAVAAVPKAGLTVSTTPCTAECLGWPIYLRLRLSVGSFFLCLLRQGIFIQGKTLLHLLFSGTSVACKCLLGVRVVGQCLQVMLADALEVKLESPRWPLSSCKFSPEKVLWDTAVLHNGNMAQPAQVPLPEYGVHDGDPCPLKHCVLGYFVSQGDAQDAPASGGACGRRFKVEDSRVESSFLHRAQSP